MYGFTLIELMVAFFLFSIVALALAQMLIGAQRARQYAENRTRAAQLASERIERLRAGDRTAGPTTIGMYTRNWSEQGFATGVRRVDVTVEWDESANCRLVLSTLMRGEP